MKNTLLFFSISLFINGCAMNSQKQNAIIQNTISSTQKEMLNKFIEKKKFIKEKMYSGTINENDRVIYENEINSLSKKLLPFADNSASVKKIVMSEFKNTYYLTFDKADTEDRERALSYFEEIMDIFNITSSDGLLNKLLYGFDPDQSEDSRNLEAISKMTVKESELLKKITNNSKESVLNFLHTNLGKPIISNKNMTVWMYESNPDNIISASNSSDKVILIWQSKDRFMYSSAIK